MKAIIGLGVSVFLSVCLFGSGPALGQDDLPEFTEEGLQLIEDSKLAVVFVDPEADLSPYSKVMLLETHVAFKKNTPSRNKVAVS